MTKKIETMEELIQFFNHQTPFNFMQQRSSLINNSIKSHDIDSAFQGHISGIIYSQLKNEIRSGSNIEKKAFIEKNINYLSERYFLSPKDIHSLSLRKILGGYFPSETFHCKKERDIRLNMDESRFQRELCDLEKAYTDGQNKITKISGIKGNEAAGRLAENVWVKVLEEYFGEQFDIHQNKKIVIEDVNSVEFDIIMTKKDMSHKSESIKDVVLLDDVVAVFEVKRKLLKKHLQSENSKAKEIVETRCIQLKQATMPIVRNSMNELTPYQMFRGKIFFGILCLDCDNTVKDILVSGDNIIDDIFYKKEFLENKIPYGDLAPDVIYCPNKLHMTKNIFIIGLDSYGMSYDIEIGKNELDLSVSTFGCLISNMRQFFVSQGHIDSYPTNAYLKDYYCFSFLVSESSYNTKKIMHRAESYFNLDMSILSAYLKTRIPNEHSSLFIRDRYPLKILKKWNRYSAKDVIEPIRIGLDTIVRLEEKYNYSPVPLGWSFEDYFSNIFKDT